MSQKKRKKQTEKWQQGRRNKIYANWEANQANLAVQFMEFIAKNKRRPTVRELCELTGLTINTVRGHLRHLEKTQLKDKFQLFKILTEQVVLSQAVNAIKGGKGAAQSAKLFLELVEGFKPGMKVEIEGELNVRNMTMEELLQRQADRAKLINSKLIRIARTSGGIRRTGSG